MMWLAIFSYCLPIRQKTPTIMDGKICEGTSSDRWWLEPRFCIDLSNNKFSEKSTDLQTETECFFKLGYPWIAVAMSNTSMLSEFPSSCFQLLRSIFQAIPVLPIGTSCPQPSFIKHSAFCHLLPLAATLMAAPKPEGTGCRMSFCLPTFKSRTANMWECAKIG